MANMVNLEYNYTSSNRINDHGATGIARGLATTFQGGSYMNYSTLPLFALKVCTVCGDAKPLSEYHKQGENLRPACKACTNAQNRSIYQKNHDSHLEAK